MLCASQSQAWDAIPACNTVKTLPMKEPAKAQEDEEGEGRDISGSLA